VLPGFQFLGACAKLRRVAVIFVMSARVEQHGFHWKDFREIGLSRKFKLHQNQDRNNGHLA
jgi:hypothetical protein